VSRRGRTLAGPTIVLGGAAILAVCGCGPGGGPRPFVRRDLGELVDRAEQDLRLQFPIRAKGGRMVVKLTEDTTTHRVDLDGLVLWHEPPCWTYLSANILGKPALYLGSNEERYWLGIVPEVNKLWWGSWSGLYAEPAQTRFVAPAYLAEVLGGFDLRTPPPEAIGPILRPSPPHHVLMYCRKDEAGQWFVAKEVFLRAADTVTVEQILYYDPRGRIQLTIGLGDYVWVKDGSRGCWLARRIEMSWQHGESYFKIDLGRITVPEHVPEAAFRFPEPGRFAEEEHLDRPSSLRRPSASAEY